MLKIWRTRKMPVKKVKSKKLKMKSLRPAAKKAKSSTVKKSELSPRSKSLIVDVQNLKGKVVGKISLPKEIFGAKINRPLMAQAVRVYLANQRQGTSRTKSRGEVEGSTRKIFRQKGTGRARHGGIRAPIFVGGGVAFGPKPRNYELAFPKKMKRKALYSSLSGKFLSGEIKVITGLSGIEPKTSVMAQIVENLDSNTKKILLVIPRGGSFENVQRAARNLRTSKVLRESLINTYEVLDNSMVLFMKEAVGEMEKNLGGDK